MMLFNMDTNKVRNLNSHLNDKYGLESVGLLQNWEGIVKKMAKYKMIKGSC